MESIAYLLTENPQIFFSTFAISLTMLAQSLPSDETLFSISSIYFFIIPFFFFFFFFREALHHSICRPQGDQLNMLNLGPNPRFEILLEVIFDSKFSLTSLLPLFTCQIATAELIDECSSKNAQEMNKLYRKNKFRQRTFINTDARRWQSNSETHG
jgi:hypothetical protein